MSNLYSIRFKKNNTILDIVSFRLQRNQAQTKSLHLSQALKSIEVIISVLTMVSSMKPDSILAETQHNSSLQIAISVPLYLTETSCVVLALNPDLPK